MGLRDDIVSTDRRFVWRPYTASTTQETQDPFVIKEAEGVWLYDEDGRRYLDANGSWWVNALGHRHPRIVRALREQTETLLHCSMAGTTHEHAAFLAKELVDVAPKGLGRVFYSDNGSTAVEVAIKIAFQYWQQVGQARRVRFLSLGGAFHGDTVGCVSVGGVPLFRERFGPMLFDVLSPPDADAPNALETSSSLQENDSPDAWKRVFAAVEALVHEHRTELAAVVVEPLIQGAAGMRMWPAEHLRRLRDVTRDAGVLLIADEVFVGYGRTGRMWACDHADVTPDLLCVAKAFSGGAFPMAATLATSQIFDGFRGDIHRALMHGHTYCGNPLGARLAREVLAIYRDEAVVENVTRNAPAVAGAFKELARIRGVRRVRTMGLVGAADLGAGGYTGHLGWQVYEAARRRGLYLRPLGDTVYICPPLTIQRGELDFLLSAVHDSVAEVMTRGV